MRLLVTADLHHDVPRSRLSAEAIIAQINETPGDAVLVVGDAATGEPERLEACLRLFTADRPRLYVPGNHDLWSTTPTGTLLSDELPRRVRACGWHWLMGDPWRRGEVAIVGNVGWYDYGFASPLLGLPDRFYEAKVSPAAAKLLEREDLLPADDVPLVARDFVARWNDGRRMQLEQEDPSFLADLLAMLQEDLVSVADASRVLAAVHHVPFEALLPRVPPGPVPIRKLKYAFARAYLGSPKLGELLLATQNVTHIVCGHSHVARQTRVGGRTAINIGSDYEAKRFVEIDL